MQQRCFQTFWPFPIFKPVIIKKFVYSFDIRSTNGFFFCSHMCLGTDKTFSANPCAFVCVHSAELHKLFIHNETFTPLLIIFGLLLPLGDHQLVLSKPIKKDNVKAPIFASLSLISPLFFP